MTATRIWGSLRSVDPAELGDAAERLLAAGADGLHLDIADGVFVPELTFGPAVARSLVQRTSAALEVHLMVVEPEAYLGELAEVGIRRLCFHLEAAAYPWRVLSQARSLGIEVGVAVNPATPLTALISVGASADFVNILTTEPDLAGEKILPGMLARVADVRAGLPGHVRIEVDGGLAPAAVAGFVAAGAVDLVVGRAVTGTPAWKPAIEQLRRSARSGSDAGARTPTSSNDRR